MSSIFPHWPRTPMAPHRNGLDVYRLSNLWAEGNNIVRLAEYVVPERRDAFVSYVRHLIANDGCYGIDGNFLGFIDDYVLFAARLQRCVDVSAPFTVFDVGCATALQHVLFDERIRYVGIDYPFADEAKTPRQQFFRDNCEMVYGRFVEIAHTLTVGPDDVGIANMSLLYGGGCADDLATFNRLFRRKIIL